LPENGVLGLSKEFENAYIRLPVKKMFVNLLCPGLLYYDFLLRKKSPGPGMLLIPLYEERSKLSGNVLREV